MTQSPSRYGASLGRPKKSKDVECTFGIMKGRWRIFQSGVRIYAVDSVDHVWFTCCALHNWLLEVDGLTQKWVGGVRKLTSDWDGDMGCLDYDSVRVDVSNGHSPVCRPISIHVITIRQDSVRAWTCS